MSTDKRSLDERIDEALERSELTPEEADQERQDEHARLRRALRHFSTKSKTLKPGQNPEDVPPGRSRGRPL